MILIALSVFALAVFWGFWAVILGIIGSMSAWTNDISTIWEWSGLGVGLILITMVILFANSSPAENLLRFMTGSRRVIEREKDLLFPMLEEVQEDVKRNCGYKPKDIKLWVSDEVMPNAWAIGKRTMIISRGLYESAQPDKIKGVMAHELGHLHAGDSRRLSIAFFLSYFISIFLWIGTALTIILKGFSALKDKEKPGAMMIVALPLLVMIIIPVYLMRFCSWFINFVLNFAGRKQEYKADLFAVKCGHGAGMLSFLDALKDFEFDKMSATERMFATHPPVMLRIDEVCKAMGEIDKV